MFGKWRGVEAPQTVGGVMAKYGGVGPGFDLLRILLAFYIFYGHALWLSGASSSVTGLAAIAGAALGETADAGADGFHGWTRPFHVAAVPIFFALSGFLVLGSALRLKATSTFLAFRVLRIFPALVLETALCAFLLGAALTTLPLGRYFSDPVFLRYLGNMAGVVSFHLPGVFEQNPVAGIVNVNLWTLPAEFGCYFVTALLMMTRLIYNRTLFTIAYGLVAIVFLVLSFTTGFGITQGLLPPVAIVFYFFTGMLFHHWKESLRAHWALFLATGAVAYVLLLFQWSVFLAPLPAVYCMVLFGMIAIPKLPLISSGDYSYGIYLYGFPITQALLVIAPGVFVGRGFLLLTASSLLTCAFAAFSWHVVEKRALTLKRHLPKGWFPMPARLPKPPPEQSLDPAAPLNPAASPAP